ncbi:hypothetical protein EVAR_36440_1 [Eumeta japonica]|uniref:Uncharacterized protein n=1 Tax=Eumeta variegata TaxID=151549 RepID=A0A4C1VSC0_EUMVA|nr:hypothetical protein EVAR_36440_1 [Eumeta japonica]
MTVVGTVRPAPVQPPSAALGLVGLRRHVASPSTRVRRIVRSSAGPRSNGVTCHRRCGREGAPRVENMLRRKATDASGFIIKQALVHGRRSSVTSSHNCTSDFDENCSIETIYRRSILYRGAVLEPERDRFRTRPGTIFSEILSKVEPPIPCLIEALEPSIHGCSYRVGVEGRHRQPPDSNRPSWANNSGMFQNHRKKGVETCISFDVAEPGCGQLDFNKTGALRAVTHQPLTEYRREVATSPVACRLESEISGGPLPSSISLPSLHRISYSYLKGRQWADNSSEVANVHGQW